MVSIGKNKFPNVCSLCSKDVEIGDSVYFDGTKPKPHHIIHYSCGEKLLAKRGERFFKTPKGTPVVTREELDPPF